jgi:hypothetical protein
VTHTCGVCHRCETILQARVKLTRSAIMIDGNMVNLSAGLSAQAEIRTGQRRVIEFLLSPLAKRVDEAGRVVMKPILKGWQCSRVLSLDLAITDAYPAGRQAKFDQCKSLYCLPSGDDGAPKEEGAAETAATERTERVSPILQPTVTQELAPNSACEKSTSSRQTLDWILKPARHVFAAFAFGLILQPNAFACPLSEPLSATEIRLRTNQESTLPRLRGIAYDVPGQRVFVSACRRHEYACDLLTVNLRGSPQQEAAYLRGPSGHFGYTWPSVSPDGNYLAAVRTPRDQRASQRDVTQELVNIDLRTGAERVLANAGDGRFDRVVYVDTGTLIVVRSFRSSPAVRCVRDICTDWAEVFVLQGESARALPIEAAAGRYRVTIVALGQSGPFWIGASSRRELPNMGYLGGREGMAWVFDVRTSVLSSIATKLPEMQALLRESERKNGSLGGWRQDDVVYQGFKIEQLPFCGTRVEHASVTQATLAGPNRGAYVAKLGNARETTFQVVALENHGGVPWRQQQQVTARYPSR